MTASATDAEHARLAQIARLSEQVASDTDVAFLIDCLGHPRKVVQRRAAEALAHAAARGLPVAAALHTALGDASLSRRWGAAYSLALIGSPPAAALPTLLDVLGANDGDLRWAAADIIKRIGVSAAPPLVHLASSGNAAQRKMALYCLRDLRITTAEAEAAVRRAVGDSDVAVRLAALAALPHLVRQPYVATGCALPLTEDADPGVRRAAITTLGMLGQRTAEIEAVIRRAANNTADPGLRRAAERAKRTLGVVDDPTSKAGR